MGNTASAKAKTEIPPDPFASSSIPELKPENQSLEDIENAPLKDISYYPGTFEELPKKTKEVIATPFEGCNFQWNKMISERFQASHTISLSSFKPSSYKFGTTYVGENKIGPNEQYPILIGEYGSGLIQFQAIHSFSKEIQAKAIIHATNKCWSMYQGDVGYKGKDFSLQLTGVNASIINPQGIWVAHYMQSITKNLALGAELMFQHGQGVQHAAVSYGGKYYGDNYELTAKTGEQGTHLCFYKKGNESVSCGVEFEYIKQIGECVTSFGYKIDLPNGLSQFKGSFDTEWSVTGVLEKKFESFPFCFTLSGLINHKKNQAKFGIGFTIG